MSTLARFQQYVLPLGILVCLLVILLPLPAPVMDFLLAANLAIAVIILLTTMFVGAPVEFNVFPTVLLASTLTRLVLNVATTRLILTRGADDQLSAAGGVVRTFGEFVSGGQVAVGLILFAIIFVIQFVVITSGATRISEVAARFSLDGMPGRQMAIDADLASGAINEKQAQTRRSQVQREADFYGSMDGASKFVRGDAVAGVFITLVNIVGGFFIGVVQNGMSFDEAAGVFTKLTIGDGLVSQVPALLISLAAGLLVTRGSHRSDLPNEFLRQMFTRPEAMFVAAAFLGLMMFTGMPKIPLLLLGGACVAVAVTTNPENKPSGDSQENKPAPVKKPAEPRIEDYLTVHPIELEVGLSLVRLADSARGGDLLKRINALRQQVATELGLVLPKVRVRDNLRLAEGAYRINLSGDMIGQASVSTDRAYAVPPSGVRIPSHVEVDRHPAFADAIATVSPSEAAALEQQGYRIFAASSVIVHHLRGVVAKHAPELLTRDATKNLLDELRKSLPTVVDELVPNQLSLGQVQAVMQNLLREGVPIRQLGTILEAMANSIEHPINTQTLTESVRKRLGRTISSKYRDNTARIQAVTLDPSLEKYLSSSLQTETHEPNLVERLCENIERQFRRIRTDWQVVVVGSRIRGMLKQVTSHSLPGLVVLSYPELSGDTRLAAVGTVTLEDVVEH